MQRRVLLEVEKEEAKVEIKTMVMNRQRDMRMAIGVVVDFREQVVDIITEVEEVRKEKLTAVLLEMQSLACMQVENHSMAHQTLVRIITEAEAEEIADQAFMDVLSRCIGEVHAR